ncbi:dTDP-glucose 4,6-dehydratase [Anaerocolumna cellulosilytica]|uniref:dTDP-glucose 4,6-dehydratase n=1 Tax=Anaerocolumna cellulosilytica TaxID=433286 RepID=A0A6S6R7U3_9FIRM|nr:dTDP-glucose 4,6-dehydratase [Anaerocolumna cellulosilytica]MBB5198060.1 dTDP-glucose 4,6-dehydratase [Anaerocolumna cellulosilytica]BCJ95078.1 dTDP-glucose 4,6-dehydratase [Anaerocolumna cellulosilytica]
MRTYLITGGMGFIGSNYIHYLYETQYMRTSEIPNCGDTDKTKSKETFRIINLDLLTYAANPEYVEEFNHLENYIFIHGDICDEELVTNILTDYEVDTIVHFAAETHVDNSIQNPDPFIKTNITGTHVLLKSAKTVWEAPTGYKDKKFLYISTDEVYGTLGKEGYFREDSPVYPKNPYSAAKASAELLCKSYYNTYGLPVLISRCSNNYGPGQHPEKLIPLLIKNLTEKKKLPIYGDGTAVRDWLYVGDHCSAIEKILDLGKPGEIYNIGCNNEKNTLEIAEILLSMIPTTPAVTLQDAVSFVPDRPGHDMRYAIDASKLTTELGWKPKTDFAQGLFNTVNWYLKKYKQ